jgi:hypothetical protein
LGVEGKVSRDLILTLFRVIDAGEWARLPELFDVHVIYERTGTAPR